VAVAAASILAREKFIGWLDRASAASGLALPKGAGPQVSTAGRAILQAKGPEGLAKLAKMHFRTASGLIS
jgi:ribonuclease HIII